jgi:hypothetical protein
VRLRQLESLAAAAVLAVACDNTPAEPDPPADTTAFESMAALFRRCPTAAEVAFVQQHLPSLDWSGDPGGATACSPGGAAGDLTRFESRIYMTLLAMSRIRFPSGMAWAPGDSTVFAWFSGQVDGIRFRNDITLSFCCAPAGVINIQTVTLAAVTLDVFDAPWGAGLMGLFVHEARHIAFGGHTCGSNDNTIAELGAWGTQYTFLRMLADAATAPPTTPQERASFGTQAEDLRTTRFCTPSAVPPGE